MRSDLASLELFTMGVGDLVHAILARVKGKDGSHTLNPTSQHSCQPFVWGSFLISVLSLISDKLFSPVQGLPEDILTCA